MEPLTVGILCFLAGVGWGMAAVLASRAGRLPADVDARLAAIAPGPCGGGAGCCRGKAGARKAGSASVHPTPARNLTGAVSQVSREHSNVRHVPLEEAMDAVTRPLRATEGMAEDSSGGVAS